MTQTVAVDFHCCGCGKHFIYQYMSSFKTTDDVEAEMTSVYGWKIDHDEPLMIWCSAVCRSKHRLNPVRTMKRMVVHTDFNKKTSWLFQLGVIHCICGWAICSTNDDYRKGWEDGMKLRCSLSARLAKE
jgi:hypothetical protein